MREAPTLLPMKSTDQKRHLRLSFGQVSFVVLLSFFLPTWDSLRFAGKGSSRMLLLEQYLYVVFIDRDSVLSINSVCVVLYHVLSIVFLCCAVYLIRLIWRRLVPVQPLTPPKTDPKTAPAGEEAAGVRPPVDSKPPPPAP